MSRRYPQELHEFMKEYIPGHTATEISAEVERRFGIVMTENMIKCYKQNRKIRSGTRCGLPAGHPSETFPEEIGRYIRENYKGTGPKEMARTLNDTFGTEYTAKQLNSFYKNHKLNSGLTGQFEKGHVPQNKGKKGMQMHPNAVATQFKKGHTPANKTPIGTVLKKDDGYLWKKVGEGCRDWKQLHRIIWEEANGPIPDGHLITFKDGNRMNVSLDNLEIVTKGESIELTRRGLRTNDKDLTETGILIARLNCKISKLKKRRKQHEIFERI